YGATENLHVEERFTRVDDNTLDHRITFSDPATYTRPWTLENTLRDSALYQFIVELYRRTLWKRVEATKRGLTLEELRAWPFLRLRLR
ncbi:MAG: hypothetical protein AAF385_08040, partial [Pseudomonadota bacterium]